MHFKNMFNKIFIRSVFSENVLSKNVFKKIIYGVFLKKKTLKVIFHIFKSIF